MKTVSSRHRGLSGAALLLLGCLQLLTQVAAHYDPLVNTTKTVSDIAQAQEDSKYLLTGFRKNQSRYQHLYKYGVTEFDLEGGRTAAGGAPSYCLHFADDTMLQNIRVAYLREMTPGREVEDLKQVVRDHESFRLNVPNVGLYYGIVSAIEYLYIAIGHRNARFVTLIEEQIVEQVPYFANRDTLATTTGYITIWNQGLQTDVNMLYREFEFRPCSIALDTLTYTFDDPGIANFLNQRFSNRYLCERIMTFCIEKNQQYDSMEDCEAFMSSLPETDPACDRTSQTALQEVSYSLEGNTSACRFLHHFMAAPDFSPNVHCPHAGKTGGKSGDRNEDLKCSTAACKTKKYKTLAESSDLPSCKDDWKDEAELALVAALPMCLAAISNKTCTDKCKQALTQFALSGYTQSTDFTEINRGLSLRTRTCICSGRIAKQPLSSVLQRIPFSASELLATCGIVGRAEDIESTLDPCVERRAFDSSDGSDEKVATDWVESIVTSNDFLKEVISDLVHRSIEKVKVTSLNQTESEAQSNSMLIDLEYVKHYTGSNFLHLLPESADKSGCPFFHGPIVGSYDEVLNLLRLDQNRTRTNALLNVDFPSDELFPAVAFAFFDSGSQEHLGLRKALQEAFPLLTKPSIGSGAVNFKRLPNDLLQLSFSDFANPPEEKLVSVTKSLMKYILELLFPKGSFAFIDQLSTVYTQWALVTEDLTVHSNIWHSLAGEGLLRLYRLNMKLAADMIESYLGPQEMEKLISYTMGTVSAEEMTRAMAGQIYNGLLVIAVAQYNLFKRIGSNPCEIVKIFKENPFSFVLEELRISRLPVAGNAVIRPKDTYTVNYLGEKIEYRGGLEWKTGSPYAVQYSLSLANNDASIFTNPEAFNPSRLNLNDTLTFGAPEYTFQSAIFASFETAYDKRGVRGCPAHNFALSLLVNVTDQLFKQEEFCYERQYQQLYSVSVTTTWILASGLFLAGLLTWLGLVSFVRPQLDNLKRRLQVEDTEDEKNSYSNQDFRIKDDSPTRMLVIHQLCVVKKKRQSRLLTFPLPRDAQVYHANKVILNKVTTQLVAGHLTGLMGPSSGGK
jgi:hypothetical protein